MHIYKQIFNQMQYKQSRQTGPEFRRVPSFHTGLQSHVFSIFFPHVITAECGMAMMKNALV